MSKLIKLTQSQSTIVDDQDFDFLNQFKWSLDSYKNNRYAASTIKNKKVRMHRLILGLTDSKIICDHRDRDGLNNQRNNLRIATRSQNNSNKTPVGKSKYLGVTVMVWGKSVYYRAAIRKDNKTTIIGYYKTEIEAALAYNSAAIKLHGEFANLNKIDSAGNAAHK